MEGRDGRLAATHGVVVVDTCHVGDVRRPRDDGPS
jgi:hypothetical protein